MRENASNPLPLYTQRWALSSLAPLPRRLIADEIPVLCIALTSDLAHPQAVVGFVFSAHKP